MKLLSKVAVVIAIALFLFNSCSKDSIMPEEPDNKLPLQFDPSQDIVLINHELRGAWVTTAWKLDWPGNITDLNAQREQLIYLIDNLHKQNINVIFFQVMTSCEAFYKSDIFPWSAYLTNEQGRDPGYDPLRVAIDAAHERGMEVHAWMNPLRVGSVNTQNISSHPAVKYPERYCVYKNVRYWNAGLPEVRDFLADAVKEIIYKYNVDGIHFDDYFYPDGLRASTLEWDDSKSFAKYGGSLDIHSWREKNIDLMVQRVYNAVKEANEDVIFGISPSGRRENSIALYADPVSWLNNRWIDYLAPQLYWQIGHPTADFYSLSTFWNSRSNSIPIFPGIAAYRLGETGFPSVLEFTNQIELGRTLPNLKGNIWFRTEHILKEPLRSHIKGTLYKYPSLVAPLGKDANLNIEAPTLSFKGNLQIEASSNLNDVDFIFYKLERIDLTNRWRAQLVQQGKDNTFRGEKNVNYIGVVKKNRAISNHSSVVYIN